MLRTTPPLPPNHLRGLIPRPRFPRSSRYMRTRSRRPSQLSPSLHLTSQDGLMTLDGAQLTWRAVARRLSCPLYVRRPRPRWGWGARRLPSPGGRLNDQHHHRRANVCAGDILMTSSPCCVPYCHCPLPTTERRSIDHSSTAIHSLSLFLCFGALLLGAMLLLCHCLS